MSVSHIIDYILSHYLFIVLFPWVMNLPTILLSSFRFLSLSSLGPPLFCGQRLFVCYRFYGLYVIYHCVNRLRVACSFRFHRYAMYINPFAGLGQMVCSQVGRARHDKCPVASDPTNPGPGWQAPFLRGGTSGLFLLSIRCVRVALTRTQPFLPFVVFSIYSSLL